HIQPMPPPPFTVLRRRQITLHHLLVSICPTVISKLLYLVWRRRHSPQIEAQPPNKRGSICFGRKAQLAPFQFRHQECIYGRPNVTCITDLRNRRPNGRSRCPMIPGVARCLFSRNLERSDQECK